MYYLVHSLELGLNWGGAVSKCFKKLGGPGPPPQAPMDGTPMSYEHMLVSINFGNRSLQL